MPGAEGGEEVGGLGVGAGGGGGDGGGGDGLVFDGGFGVEAVGGVAADELELIEALDEPEPPPQDAHNSVLAATIRAHRMSVSPGRFPSLE